MVDFKDSSRIYLHYLGICYLWFIGDKFRPKQAVAQQALFWGGGGEIWFWGAGKIFFLKLLFSEFEVKNSIF